MFRSRRKLVLVLAALALAVGVPTALARGGDQAGAGGTAEAVQGWNELARLGAEVLDKAGVPATVEVDESGLTFLSVAPGDEPAAAGALVEAVLACSGAYEAVQGWNELTRLGAEVLDKAGVPATVEVEESGLTFLSVAPGDEPAAAGALVEAVLACD